MVLDINPKDIAEESSLENVYHCLSTTATQFAILGRIETARNLITLLPASAVKDLRFIMRPLLLAWECTEHWPHNIARADRTEETLDDIRESHRLHWPTYVDREDQTHDAGGAERALNIPDRTKIFADASTGSAAMDKSLGLVKALEIYLDLDESEHEPDRKRLKTTHMSKGTQSSASNIYKTLNTRSREVLDQIAGHIDANQQVYYVANSSRLWPLLRDGVLAYAIAIDAKELDSKAQAITDAFTNRLHKGWDRPSYLDGSISDLLQICNDNTLKNAASVYEEDGSKPPESLYHEAASEKVILAVEKKLDVKLPSDYREFLATSNGFLGIWNGIYPSLPLHDTTQLRWIDTEKEDYFKLEVDLIPLPTTVREMQQSDEPGDHKPILPEVDRVVEIGTRDIDNLWLVPPQLVERVKDRFLELRDKAAKEDQEAMDKSMEAFAGSTEKFRNGLDWCCLLWSSGGAATMEAFSSFRSYLEHMALESHKT